MTPESLVAAVRERLDGCVWCGATDAPLRGGACMVRKPCDARIAEKIEIARVAWEFGRRLRADRVRRYGWVPQIDRYGRRRGLGINLEED